MSTARRPGSTPHAAYIHAVAAGHGTDGRYTTGRYTAWEERAGLLAAMLHYPTHPHTTGGTLHTAVADPAVWPHGLDLYWNQRHGWSYAAVDTDGRSAHPEVPLPVATLASPRAIAALLPALLAGDTTDLPTSTQRWQHAAAHAPLLGRLDVIEALTGHGWSSCGPTDGPTMLRKNAATWSLTWDIDDVWRWEDFSDSHLTGPGWSATFRREVPCHVILAACQAAAQRADREDPQAVLRGADQDDPRLADLPAAGRR